MVTEKLKDPEKTVVVLGIDVGRGDDYTHFTIYDNVNEEVLYSGTDINEIRKHKIASIQIEESDVVLWAEHERD